MVVALPSMFWLYAGLNWNTKQPHKAFMLLDYLLSTLGARFELYGYLTYPIGMPVKMDVGTEETPISYVM